MEKREATLQFIAAAYDAGFRVVAASCSCGGRWAWAREQEGRGSIMVGCVCHKSSRVQEILGAEGNVAGVHSCGGDVYHRPGKPGEYDHTCLPASGEVRS